MAINFTCQCGTTMKVRDEYAGSPVKCSGCKTTVKVPGPGGAASSVSANVSPYAKPAGVPTPWYYSFMVGISFLGVVIGLLQFFMFALGFLSQQSRGSEASVGVETLIISGGVLLGAVLSYAVALVLADIGRNVRRVLRQS